MKHFYYEGFRRRDKKFVSGTIPARSIENAKEVINRTGKIDITHISEVTEPRTKPQKNKFIGDVLASAQDALGGLWGYGKDLIGGAAKGIGSIFGSIAGAGKTPAHTPSGAAEEDAPNESIAEDLSHYQSGLNNLLRGLVNQIQRPGERGRQRDELRIAQDKYREARLARINAPQKVAHAKTEFQHAIDRHARLQLRASQTQNPAHIEAEEKAAIQVDEAREALRKAERERDVIAPMREREARREKREKQEEARWRGSLGGKFEFLGKEAEKAGAPGTAKFFGEQASFFKALLGDPQAIAKTVANTFGHGKTAYQHLSTGATGQFGGPQGTELYGDRPEAAAVETFKGLDSIGKMLGPAGLPLRGLAKLGEVAFGAVDRLKMWSHELHQANMRFAEFSGSMAMVQAEQQVRDISYSIRRGEARAGMAQQQAFWASAARESTADFEDMRANNQAALNTAMNQLFSIGQRWLRRPWESPLQAGVNVASETEQAAGTLIMQGLAELGANTYMSEWGRP